MDEQLGRAIAKAVGHDLPASPDELGSIKTLSFDHARDLRGLQDCTSVRMLLLTGCDPVSLDALAGLRELELALVEFSGLSSLDGVQAFPESFLSLKVRCNLVTDLSPLLEGPPIARLEVPGNPLSEDSFQRVLPELSRRGVRVVASDEREWRLTLRLHAVGLPFSYYRARDGYRLCRPGLAFTDRPEASHPIIEPDDLERLLGGNPAEIHALFAREDLMWPASVRNPIAPATSAQGRG